MSELDLEEYIYSALGGVIRMGVDRREVAILMARRIRKLMADGDLKKAGCTYCGAIGAHYCTGGSICGTGGYSWRI